MRADAPVSIGHRSIPTVSFSSLIAPPAMARTLNARSGETRKRPTKNLSLRKTPVASLALLDLKAETSQSVSSSFLIKPFSGQEADWCMP